MATHSSILAWKNLMDRRAWWAAVHWVPKSRAPLGTTYLLTLSVGFPGGSDSKESVSNVGGPGSGRSPGEGNGNPLQCSCLENPMDRGAWWATVHGVSKRRTRLSD